MLFTSSYVRALDDKNRLQIPTQFKSGVADPEREREFFYLCPGEYPRTLALYQEKYFEERIEHLRQQAISDEESLELESFFARVVKIDLDKQRRFVVPDAQLAYADFPSKELVLAGANLRINIWSKPDFEAFMGRKSDQNWPQIQRHLRGAAPRGNGAPVQ